ncbi:C40 family peptidase [Enterococcus sp. LJL90]
MKKAKTLWFKTTKICILCSTLLSVMMLPNTVHASGNNFSAEEYAQKEKEGLDAGYSLEQFEQIMQIPDLPHEEKISDRGVTTFAAMSSDQTKIVQVAEAQLGKPYVSGAQGPNSFDCGGLVKYVYKQAVNIELPMGTYNQEKYGRDVSMSALQPGDLLFYGNRGSTYHVAIYVGNNQMIYAPQPGQKVKRTSLTYYYPSFAKRILKDTTPAPTVNASLDTVSMNTYDFLIDGWMTTTENIQSTTPFVFFMDSNTGKEITRLKMTRKSRTDVSAVYPTVNGSNVGWIIKGGTPEVLLGRQFKILVRYATDSQGNAWKLDKTFPTVYSLPGKVNDGNLDVIQTEGNLRKVIGWHAAWNSPKGTNRFVFLLENGKEVARAKIDSSITRTDVASYVGKNVAGVQNSGFQATFDVTKLKGKNLQIMHRYASDTLGNQIINDFYFPGTYKF